MTRSSAPLPRRETRLPTATRMLAGFTALLILSSCVSTPKTKAEADAAAEAALADLAAGLPEESAATGPAATASTAPATIAPAEQESAGALPGDPASDVAKPGIPGAILQPAQINANRASIFSTGGPARPGARSIFSTAPAADPAAGGAGEPLAYSAPASPGSLVTQAYMGADDIPELMRGDFYSSDDLQPDDDKPAGLMKLASLSGMTRVAPNGLITHTPKVEVGCFKPELLGLISAAEKHFGRKALVTSGYRDAAHNRAVGGVEGSMHLTCAAADIQIDGVTKLELASFLRAQPGRGGVGTYCHTSSVHVDIGEKRDWNWRCRKQKEA